MDTNKIRKYADFCHESTNHLYDGQPYRVHLNYVIFFAGMFNRFVPVEKIEIVFAACSCHDLIEDTRQTYNDVKKNTSEEVADIVFAVTTEKGKTREERNNDKYYYGILATPYALFVKLCDRLANTEYSKKTGSSMFKTYQQEYPHFRGKLSTYGQYTEMFDYLDRLNEFK